MIGTLDPKIPGGPLANKLVRQAIGYSIDYDGIIKGLMKGAAVQPPTMRSRIEFAVV